MTSRKFGPASLEPRDSFRFWPKPGHALSVGQIRGEVQLSDGVNRWDIGPDPLTGSDPVIFVQEEIRTGPGGRAEFIYEDGSVFKIKPNSTVRVLSDGLYLEHGDILLKIKKEGPKFFTTQEAIGGVLGTVFAISAENDGSSTWEVAEGQVLLSSNVTGDQISVTSGNAGTASADGTVSVAPFDADAMLASWEMPTEAAPISAEPEGNIDVGVYLMIIGGGALLALLALLFIRSRAGS